MLTAIHHASSRFISLVVGSPAGLLLEVHIGQRHTGVILHDEASVRFLDGLRRLEAAGRHNTPLIRALCDGE